MCNVSLEWRCTKIFNVKKYLRLVYLLTSFFKNIETVLRYMSYHLYHVFLKLMDRKLSITMSYWHYYLKSNFN